MIAERLEKLRQSMKKAGIDCYLIPTSDYHDSEYISDYFKVRSYFSGFTGSAGTLVVTQQKAALFTDGRYFIQAAKELSGTEIRLMKMGEAGVPTLKEYLEQILETGWKLGFDGRLVQAGEAQAFEQITQKKQGGIIFDRDLAQEIWQDRPALIHHPVYRLADCYTGEKTEHKLKRLREKMQKEGAEVHLLTSLDDIAWLLNIRGNDVESCPVFLSYAAVEMDKVLLFAKEREHDPVWEGETADYLQENGVMLRLYDSFYEYAAGLHGKKVLVSLDRINYRLKKELPEDACIIDRQNPTMLMKAVKNEMEMENLRKAHLKDGIAVTHFMYWLKQNIGKISMDEVSAEEYLSSLREKQENYIEPSFGTISAYGSNGAIVHYSAKKGSCAALRPEGFLMVDSGGHYLEGTTDITRTFVLGPVTEEMKFHFTLVLKAVLNLKSTKFLYGCRGANLDIRAREVLWEYGLDYKHGTGHGVGYVLNVHEGPNSFRWRLKDSLMESPVLEEGMVTTDEPGIYIEGSHGIRTENELLCRKGEENEYGQFMYFEDLTYVPIDLQGVECSLLTDKEKETLNEYHRQVYEKLSPYFEGEEKSWLKHVTREID